jgi:hypothetical protein
MSGSQMVGVSVVSVLIGAVAVSVGGVGVAVAANGGSLVLGHTNRATSLTRLDDPKGTPLALTAGHGAAPLTVNSSKQVAHLNASLLGGDSASSLQTAGSAVSSHYPITDGSDVSGAGSLVASSAALPAGTYYATADAYVDLPADTLLECELSTSDLVGAAAAFRNDGVGTLGAAAGYQTVTQTAPIVVGKGQRIGYYCRVSSASSGDPADTTELFETGLTVIKVDRSSAGSAESGHSEAIRKRQP